MVNDFFMSTSHKYINFFSEVKQELQCFHITVLLILHLGEQIFHLCWHNIPAAGRLAFQLPIFVIHTDFDKEWLLTYNRGSLSVHF